MIGVIVITHGELGRELINVVEDVLGKQEAMAFIKVDKVDHDDYIKEIKDTIKKLKADSGVILLTDLFGGTPSNLALSFSGDKNIEIISGANLPVLIDIAQQRQRLGLKECAKRAVKAGRDQINLASELLNSSVY